MPASFTHTYASTEFELAVGSILFSGVSHYYGQSGPQMKVTLNVKGHSFLIYFEDFEFIGKKWVTPFNLINQSQYSQNCDH